MALDRTRIVSAALELLAKGGLAAVTMRSLADQLNVKGATLYHYFQGKQELLDEMIRVMLAKSWGPPEPGEDWRDWLRRGARITRRTLLAYPDGARLVAGSRPTSDLDGESISRQLDPLLAEGFSADNASNAIHTIGRFTLGWSLDEEAAAARGVVEPSSWRDAQFEFGLDVIIAGLAAVGRQALPSTMPARRRMVAMRIWTLLRQIRQSADLAYNRAVGLGELERRLLMELQRQSDTRSADLTLVSGLDKAQISRALRRLLELGLVDREGIRSPIELTREGRRLADICMRLAHRRNTEFAVGLDEESLRNFEDIVSHMTVRAIALLEKERALAAGSAEDVPPAPEGEPALPTSTQPLLVPPLVTLFVYMQRSGAMLIRRLTDLSNFDAMVLSAICEEGPLTLTKLIGSLERDHSQAGRTVKRLTDAGLVEREKLAGRRGRLLRVTDLGRSIFNRIDEEAQRADFFLMGGISPQQIDRFLATLDTISANITRQTERDSVASPEQDAA